MRLYIARHGQVCPQDTVLQDPDLPREDPLLTALGIEQARLLGQRLNQEDFNGKIYASPFRRTLMTAQIISQETGCPIYCSHAIREIVKVSGTLKDFKGLTMEQILELYPSTVPTDLPYPWWQDETETFSQVCQRVSPFISELIEKNEDCLLIGHGASVSAANYLLQKRSGKRFNEVFKVAGFNCSLSEYLIEEDQTLILRYYDYSHIPLSMLSSNRVMALEDQDPEEKEVCYK